MRLVFLLLAAGIAVSGQERILPLVAEFDLHTGLKPHSVSRTVRSYFTASPSGLTLVTIDGNSVAFFSADLEGRIRHARSDLASVHAQIYAALPLADGSVWILSAEPYRLLEPFGTRSGFGVSDAHAQRGSIASSHANNYTNLDRYGPDGKHLDSLRLLSFVGGSRIPEAAANELLVLRNGGAPGFQPQEQFFYFGTVVDGRFEERARVRVSPAVAGAIPIIASNGNLLLIDKQSGNRLVIDPSTNSGSVVRLAKPRPVRAAATDSHYVYLLSGDKVLKTNIAGELLATYLLQFQRGFRPASVGVTGDTLYLVDNGGHILRFDGTDLFEAH